MISNDDVYLAKLIGAGLPHALIAARLGISVEEVGKRWERMREEVILAKANGHGMLCEQYNVLCSQYQLLGESLKIVAAALGNTMPTEELKLLIVRDQEQTLKNLTQSCIILRPFVPIDPAASLEEHLKATREGN